MTNSPLEKGVRGIDNNYQMLTLKNSDLNRYWDIFCFWLKISNRGIKASFFHEKNHLTPVKKNYIMTFNHLCTPTFTH